ncbi:putative replication protein A, OB [Rosa chinensis]|uniref:Putative replication protein A, OB n=1 Tax=Rosa chinensis TaxID=74649 RepID=A0A2P6RXQ4_ROSCH|nr:putative replication protein A, OB [Rosa chinensis]
MARPTLIHELRPFQLNFTMRIRVSRIWRPQRFQSEIYDGLHNILTDERGDMVHAKIDESDYPHVLNKMEQGRIYDISHFNTSKIQGRYKVVNHEVQLRFNELTKFEPVEHGAPPIPEYSFHLLEFNQLGLNPKPQTLLIDVYGCIKSVIPEHQVLIKDTNKMEPKCEVVMENLRREDLRITLWGDVARKFDLETIRASPSPVLAVVTSLRITQFQEQITTTATNHSCVFINPEIQQAQEYRAEFSRPGDKVKILPPPPNRQTPEQVKEKTTISVSELHTLDPDSYTNQSVCCIASIRRFSLHSGWWYKACGTGTCYRQLTEDKDTNDLKCSHHGIQIPVPWYKVHMIIYDRNNQATVLIMGKEAEQLFGISCADLLKKELYGTELIVLEEMQKTADQTYLFELKFNMNNELFVRNIFPTHQASASLTQQEPTTTTPDRFLYQKKRNIEGSSRTVSLSESEKKLKSEEQIKHRTTVLPSSTMVLRSKELYEKKKAE